MAGLNLLTPSGGYVNLSPTNTATNVSLNLPAANGTVIYSDTSGYVGIGTSSPGSKLEINGNQIVNYSGQSQSLLTIGGNSTSAAMNLRGSTGSAYAWQISSNSFVGSALEFTRSTSVGGTTFSTPSMLLDSSGNLLVGATSNVTAASRLVVQTATDGQISINCSNGPTTAYSTLNFTSQGTYKAQIYWYQGNSNFYAVNGYGGVYMATNGTSWNANSDERLKDIIEPITNAVSKVSALRAVIGKYKTDEEGTRKPFLIAQDVEVALPEAVTRAKLPRSEDETEYLGVAYTDTIPLLVAAIKELSAELNELKQKVNA